MTAQEIEHQNWKQQMRQEALEKELVRLRKIEKTQSKKIIDLKKGSIFLLSSSFLVFFILVITGVISFSKQNNSTPTQDIVNNSKILEDSITFLNKKIEILINTKAKIRNEDGYKFKIQFGAFKSHDLDKFEEDLVSISQEKYDTYNQYTLGSFSNYDKAKQFLQHMHEIGFSDSFITSTYFGKKIPIEQAIKNTKDKSD